MIFRALKKLEDIVSMSVVEPLLPGIAATCDIDECKLHYYGSLRMVNPSGVVPKGPKLDFTARHGRG
jgi:glutathionyl-hydroquinone reductase